jgi:LAGLIDADG endonuclease
MVIYSVGKIDDIINIVIPNFEKFTLLTQKAADFILFKEIIELMRKKEHLSFKGFQQIINIKASINLGLSELIKSNFKNNISVERPIITTNNIPDSNWVADFTTGEGNFDFQIIKSETHKIRQRVLLRFRIYQHVRDLKLMELLINYLGAGKIEKQQNTQVVSLIINKISEISNIVIPFFK